MSGVCWPLKTNIWVQVNVGFVGVSHVAVMCLTIQFHNFCGELEVNNDMLADIPVEIVILVIRYKQVLCAEQCEYLNISLLALEVNKKTLQFSSERNTDLCASRTVGHCVIERFRRHVSCSPSGL
jgi:hypothetical protein